MLSSVIQQTKKIQTVFTRPINVTTRYYSRAKLSGKNESFPYNVFTVCPCRSNCNLRKGRYYSSKTKQSFAASTSTVKENGVVGEAGDFVEIHMTNDKNKATTTTENASHRQVWTIESSLTKNYRSM